MLPLIGLTTYGRNPSDQFYLYASYAKAIRAADGLPVLLPPGEPHPEALLARLDGLVFTGGGDLSPQGTPHPSLYGMNPERDCFELELARLALASSVPVLGICRGMQVLSLASGGKPLIPHVPEVFTQMLHRREPASLGARAQPVSHPVQVQPGRLRQLVGCDGIPVVSWHHQAVQAVPPGWQLAATAPDGLIEAIEHAHHPWLLAVQWHPEMSLADGYQLKIFQGLVAAAREAQKKGPRRVPSA